jgi:SnoaL-like domain
LWRNAPQGPSQGSVLNKAPSVVVRHPAFARRIIGRTRHLRWPVVGVLRDTDGTMPEEPTAPDLVESTSQIFTASNEASNVGGVVDAWIGHLAPDVVWESVGLGTSFQGVNAVRAFLENWTSRYGEYDIETREILDLGNGIVFSVTAHTGRPVGGIGDVRMPTEVLTHSFTWEDGTITRVVSSGDRPDARVAAERLAERG